MFRVQGSGVEGLGFSRLGLGLGFLSGFRSHKGSFNGIL